MQSIYTSPFEREVPVYTRGWAATPFCRKQIISTLHNHMRLDLYLCEGNRSNGQCYI